MTARLLGVMALCLWLVAPARAADPADSHKAAGEHVEHAEGHDHAAGGHHDHIGLADAGLGLEKPEEIRSDLAFFTFVVFLLLIAILWKFAWGPIAAGLDKREHGIAGQIAEAQRMHEEAKQQLADYERKLATAADEVRAIVEQGRKDGERVKQDILTEARAGADAERARAVRDIEAATDSALKSLAERSANLAVELAGKIVKSKLTPDDHARLIQEAVAKFPQSAGRN
jgi:F-type H+-transporting ATPase subunit b